MEVSQQTNLNEYSVFNRKHLFYDFETNKFVTIDNRKCDIMSSHHKYYRQNKRKLSFLLMLLQFLFVITLAEFYSKFVKGSTIPESTHNHPNNFLTKAGKLWPNKEVDILIDQVSINEPNRKIIHSFIDQINHQTCIKLKLLPLGLDAYGEQMKFKHFIYIYMDTTNIIEIGGPINLGLSSLGLKSQHRHQSIILGEAAFKRPEVILRYHLLRSMGLPLDRPDVTISRLERPIGSASSGIGTMMMTMTSTKRYLDEEDINRLKVLYDCANLKNNLSPPRVASTNSLKENDLMNQSSLASLSLNVDNTILDEKLKQGAQSIVTDLQNSSLDNEESFNSAGHNDLDTLGKFDANTVEKHQSISSEPCKPLDSCPIIKDDGNNQNDEARNMKDGQGEAMFKNDIIHADHLTSGTESKPMMLKLDNYHMMDPSVQTADQIALIKPTSMDKLPKNELLISFEQQNNNSPNQGLPLTNVLKLCSCSCQTMVPIGTNDNQSIKPPINEPPQPSPPYQPTMTPHQGTTKANQPNQPTQPTHPPQPIIPGEDIPFTIIPSLQPNGTSDTHEPWISTEPPNNNQPTEQLRPTMKPSPINNGTTTLFPPTPTLGPFTSAPIQPNSPSTNTESWSQPQPQPTLPFMPQTTPHTIPPTPNNIDGTESMTIPNTTTSTTTQHPQTMDSNNGFTNSQQQIIIDNNESIIPQPGMACDQVTWSKPNKTLYSSANIVWDLDDHNQNYFICSNAINNEIVPGKTHGISCAVSSQGKSYELHDFKVLTKPQNVQLAWVQRKSDQFGVSNLPVVGGKSASGDPYIVSRCIVKDESQNVMTLVGYVNNNNVGWFPFDDIQIECDQYDVLACVS